MYNYNNPEYSRFVALCENARLWLPLMEHGRQIASVITGNRLRMTKSSQGVSSRQQRVVAVRIIVAASLFKPAVGLCFFQDQLLARFEREYVRDGAVTTG